MTFVTHAKGRAYLAGRMTASRSACDCSGGDRMSDGCAGIDVMYIPLTYPICNSIIMA